MDYRDWIAAFGLAITAVGVYYQRKAVVMMREQSTESSRSYSMWKLWMPTVALCVLAILCWVPVMTRIKPYAPFNAAYDTYKSDLGEPLAKEQKISQVAQAKFKNAWVFWTKESNSLYRFPIGDGTWSEIYHPSPPGDVGWAKQKAGGVKYAQALHPEEWSWIGPIESYCALMETNHQATYIQEFQNGKILGLVRSLSGDNRSALIVLLHNGTVRDVQMNGVVNCLP
jgi:hypothetical protein